MTETGCASAARGRNGRFALFSPAGGKRRHSSRNKKERPLPSSSFACGPSAAAAAVPVMSQAIQAMKGLVAEQGKDTNQTTNGPFKKPANGQLIGDIVTPSIPDKGVAHAHKQHTP